MFAKKICIGKLPHAGLGNKLFIWAQVTIFSHINKCEFIFSGWAHIHVRTLLKIFLKKEKRHEYYISPFKFNWNAKTILSLILNIPKAKRYLSQIESSNKIEDEGVFIFSKMSKPPEYFGTIKDYRKLIIENFHASLKRKIRHKINEKVIPIVGVHIRRGDFINEMITPISYFKNCITHIRNYVGYDIPVTLFTNANQEDAEIKELLSMPQTSYALEDAAIIHLVLLSQSKIIITSHNSTFGYWAGFLSNAIIINTELFEGESIRDRTTNEIFYEGVLPSSMDKWPELLLKNLKLLQV
jgi:hypothetical protein